MAVKMGNFFIGIIRRTTMRFNATAEGSRMLPSKRGASSKARVVIFALVFTCFVPLVNAIALSAAERERIGKRIWQNECNGTIAGLTSWNAGENFASVGIGHFIWYPKNVHGPFDESFPKLVSYISSR